MSITEEYGFAKGKGVLRGLLADIWLQYSIRDFRSNDAQGMANQVKNLMNKMESRHLPRYEKIDEFINALLKAMGEPTSDLEPNDLKMISRMPDLRVEVTGTFTRFDEGSGYEHDEDRDYAREISCEALRKRAAEILGTLK